MGRQDFGRLVRRKRTEKGLSLGLLGIRIGELPSGAYLDATGVRTLENGGRAIEDDQELYERVVSVLEIDPDEAHAALFGLPEGITLEDIKELRRTASELLATRRMTAAGRVASPAEGARSAAPQSATDRGEQTTLYFYVPAGQDAA